MLKIIFKKRRILLLIDIILLIVSINCYRYIYQIEQVKSVFVGDAVKFVEENNNPMFKINKIVLYSSAYAVDNSESKNLQSIDISQFTDIGVYIDNKGKIAELTEENTINEMYIDNIKLTLSSETNECILNYKNPESFAKYEEISNYFDDRISFKIIHSNDEQIEVGNSESTFYTDCSNPISLGFINKNILTNCKIDNANVNGKISFDGSILRNANIDLNSISGNIGFTIHIKNNLDQDFACTVNLDNKFEDVENGIYSGYVMKILNTEGEEYNFLRVYK